MKGGKYEFFDLPAGQWAYPELVPELYFGLAVVLPRSLSCT